MVKPDNPLEILRPFERIDKTALLFNSSPTQQIAAAGKKPTKITENKNMNPKPAEPRFSERANKSTEIIKHALTVNMIV